MGTEEVKKEIDVSNWHSELLYGEWTSLPVSGPRASARYKHAAAIADEKLYIVGGSRNGRLLSDVQFFDLRSLAWSNMKLRSEQDSENAEVDGPQDVLQDVLPAISDHRMIKWGNRLLLIGGHSRRSSDSMTVRYIDLETHVSGVVEASGKVPVSRGGHSATLVGSRLYVFGGEDRKRRLLNDFHFLDLETMTWDVVESMQTPPAPRFDHSAAIRGERYLFIFGGCSRSIFYSDLHVFDLQTMEWSQPEVQGDVVSPRAGHAGITVDENWFIVGGGDNNNGCSETFVLNMSKLVWSTVSNVQPRHPLASEGLSVCSVSIFGENFLVAFGGYNGKYNSEIFFMKLKPQETSRPKIFQSPAAAAAAASVTAAYALAKSEKLEFPRSMGSAYGEAENNLSKKDLKTEIDALNEEKKMLELSLVEVRTENLKLREKVDELNSSHAELSQELQSVQGQLIAERSRCFKLEAQIVELQKLLESMQSIESEVQSLRKQKSALDQEELAAAQSQGSSGIWRWIASGT